MKKNYKVLIVLHILLVAYSISSVFSKLAAREAFLSAGFCLYYSIAIFLLGIYALGWQQILKVLPLITAYSNKAITVIWGIVWGTLFFGETVTSMKVYGILLIILGIILFAQGEKNE